MNTVPLTQELEGWLLDGPSWMIYRLRIDLLDQGSNEPHVQVCHQEMVAHPLVQELVMELAFWPGKAFTSHKSAALLYHKLIFLADIGYRVEDSGMAAIIEKMMALRSSEGVFLSPLAIGRHYGGDGEDRLTWMLCDAPNLVYALVKLGLGDDPRVQKALDFLISLISDNGWRCTVSPDIGGFRGPGKKTDPCPYATLIMLKLIGQIPDLRESEAARRGIETLLTLWDQRREQHPFLFHMGNDFCKLKAPLVWYDILHVLDVLTLFPSWRSDHRLKAMAAVALEKADLQGQYRAESIWQPWKTWDFGQKKTPSCWITFLMKRIEQRLSD